MVIYRRFWNYFETLDTRLLEPRYSTESSHQESKYCAFEIMIKIKSLLTLNPQNNL